MPEPYARAYALPVCVTRMRYPSAPPAAACCEVAGQLASTFWSLDMMYAAVSATRRWRSPFWSLAAADELAVIPVPPPRE